MLKNFDYGVHCSKKYSNVVNESQGRLNNVDIEIGLSKSSQALSIRFDVDERKFPMNGAVNKDNLSFWGTERSGEHSRMVMNSSAATKWCVISKERIIGLYLSWKCECYWWEIQERTNSFSFSTLPTFAATHFYSIMKLRPIIYSDRETISTISVRSTG